VASVELFLSSQVDPCPSNPAQFNHDANTMPANALHITKKGGSEEEVNTSTVRNTPSDPNQLLRFDINPWSEVNQISTRDDDAPYVVERTIPAQYGEPLIFDLSCRPSTRDLASTFFAAATGTTVSGAAHFTSNNTTSNHLTVHINRTSR
jgi:hypothetical protein